MAFPGPTTRELARPIPARELSTGFAGGAGIVVGAPSVPLMTTPAEAKLTGPGQFVDDIHTALARSFVAFHGLGADPIDQLNWWATEGLQQQLAARPIGHAASALTIRAQSTQWTKPQQLTGSDRVGPLWPRDADSNRQPYKARLSARFLVSRPAAEAKGARPYVTEPYDFGLIPAFKGSIMCNLTDAKGNLLPPEELARRGECVNDRFGYFINGGKKYAVIVQDQLRKNVPMIYSVSPDLGVACVITNKSARGTTPRTTIYRDQSGRYGPVLRVRVDALGPEIVVDLYTMFGLLAGNGFDANELTERLIGLSVRGSRRATRMRAILTSTRSQRTYEQNDDLTRVLGEAKTKLNITSLEALRELVGLELFPQLLPLAELGRSAPLSSTVPQQNLLTHMAVMYLEYLVDVRRADDRDSWAARALESTAARMERMWAKVWNMIVVGIEAKLAKYTEPTNEEIEAAIRSQLGTNVVTKEFHSIFATANASENDPGSDAFTQSIVEDSSLSIFVYTRKVVPNVSAQSTLFALRMVQPSQLGFVCYVATPENAKCGLIKFQAIGCRISIEADPEPVKEAFRREFKLLTQARLLPGADAKANTRVFVNYDYLGQVPGDTAYRYALEARRGGRFPWDCAIIYRPADQVLIIMTTGSRPTRPLLVMDQTSEGPQLRLTTRVLVDDRTGRPAAPWEVPFEVLLQHGMVEFIDAAEQGTWGADVSTVPSLLVAQSIWDLEEKVTAVKQLEEQLRSLTGELKSAGSEPTAAKKDVLLVRGGPEYKKLLAEDEKLTRERNTIRAGTDIPGRTSYALRNTEARRAWRDRYEALFYGPLWERLREHRDRVNQRLAEINRDRPAKPDAKYWANHEAVAQEREQVYDEIRAAELNRRLVEPEGKDSPAVHPEGKEGKEAKAEDPRERFQAQITHVTRMLERARAAAAFTHMEVDPALAFSAQASTIPLPQHNQAPRNTYHCKQANQSLGVMHTRWLNQFALQMRIAAYPQRPLLESSTAAALGADLAPSGQSVRLTLATFAGWNTEDSFVLRKGAMDLGLYHYLQYVTYERELNSSSGVVERFGMTTRTPSMIHIGERGVAEAGSPLTAGQAVIVITRTTAATATTPESVVTVTEDIVAGKEGSVDEIHFYTTEEGREAVRVRLVSYHEPDIGDKGALRPAQKFTLAIIYPDADMPFYRSAQTVRKYLSPRELAAEARRNPKLRYWKGGLVRENMPKLLEAPKTETKRGEEKAEVKRGGTVIQLGETEPGALAARGVEERKRQETKEESKTLVARREAEERIAVEDLYEENITPDVIMNPHAIPSRMTIGSIIEMVASDAAIKMGVRFNASAFRPFNEQEFLATLGQLGFRRAGMYVLRNGVTGELTRAPVYIGFAHVAALKFQVKDKEQVRGRGRRNKQNMQGLAGRSRKGGAALRVGEMERDAFIGHGVAKLIEERFCTLADRYELVTCRRCRDYTTVQLDPRTGSYTCRGCESAEMLGMMSFPFGMKSIINRLAVIGVRLRLQTVVA